MSLFKNITEGKQLWQQWKSTPILLYFLFPSLESICRVSARSYMIIYNRYGGHWLWELLAKRLKQNNFEQFWRITSRNSNSLGPGSALGGKGEKTGVHGRKKKSASEASRLVVWVGEREGVWNSLTKQKSRMMSHFLALFPQPTKPLSFSLPSSTLLRGEEVWNTLTKSG